MTAVEREAVNRALESIREGVPVRQAIRSACRGLSYEHATMGDFQEGWDTLTTWLPWIGAGIAGIFVYRGAVKAHRVASDYIGKKRRQYAAAKAVWDATL